MNNVLKLLYQVFMQWMSNQEEADTLSNNQEEADTKVTLHAYSILKNINPEKYVIIRSHSGDIDINIIAMSLLVTYLASVYIDYGNASSRKGIYLSELNLIKSEKESLLGMHAFFGNDFMSSFFRKSKVHCWKIMKTSDNSRKHLNYWEILKGVMTLLVFREICLQIIRF